MSRQIKAAMAAALVLALSAGAQAQQAFSDYRPLNGDGELVVLKKLNALLSCNYARINSNTTTTLKSGKGVLHGVTIGVKGATSNTATLYDNTAGSGTVIAVIDTTSNVATLLYDVAFSTGLTVVTATGTAADLTVAYR
jgi:hypothetical protein